MIEGVLVWLGITNASGRAYLAWSGAGSDLSELAIVGAVIGGYRRHSCHARRCWRIGRHVVDGSPWCNRHHQAARNSDPGIEAQ